MGGASHEELVCGDYLLMHEDDNMRLATVLPPTPSSPSTPPSPIPFHSTHSVGSSTNSSNDTLDPELFYDEYGTAYTLDELTG